MKLKMAKATATLLIAVFLVSTMAMIPMVRASDTWTVNPDGTADFTTIQAAINAGTTHSGDTIIVAAGTYNEQVLISKSLTLQGEGDTTIISPSTDSLSNIVAIPWSGSTVNCAPIIWIRASGVTVENLKVDGSLAGNRGGASWTAGILSIDTSEVIDSVTVTHITPETMTSTAYRGQGIVLVATSISSSVEVKNCRISDFDKNGINALGNMLTVNIHDNTITGRGALPDGDEVQNGILIADGATGTVDSNTISDMAYIPQTWWCIGIFFYGGSGSADRNTITNVQIGILFQDGSGSATGNTVDGGTVGLLGLYAQYYTAGTYTISFTGNTVTGHIENTGSYINDAIGAATYDAGASLTVTIDSNTLTSGSSTADGIQIGDTVANGAAGSVAATITHNSISNWPKGIDFFDTIDYTNTHVNSNDIVGNTVGVSTTVGGTIDATSNWWGDASGPQATTNPDGLGNQVSDNVNYADWLVHSKDWTQPQVVATYPTTEQVVLRESITSLLTTLGDNVIVGENATVAGTSLDYNHDGVVNVVDAFNQLHDAGLIQTPSFTFTPAAASSFLAMLESIYGKNLVNFPTVDGRVWLLYMLGYLPAS